jgi:hypothetical protein
MTNSRTRKLRAWMTLKGLRVKGVAEANEVTLNAVYKYVRGDMTSAGLHSWFAAQGCPASYLPTAKAAKRIPSAARKAA